MKEILIIVTLFISINTVNAKIRLEVKVDKEKNVNIMYSGFDINIITNEDIKLFDINDNKLREAVKTYYGRKPNDVYLKSPTPWGDLYKVYKWEQVSRILSIKSARIKNMSTHPVIVLAQDSENFSNKTVKVNTGITHTIENTITRSWSKEKEISISQEIEYDVNLIIAEGGGITSFEFATNWGVSEERTESQTIGANSGMETELEPGKAVTAVLSGNVGSLEIEVFHKASLRGNLAVNFKKELDGHHFWGPRIQDVLKRSGFENEVVYVETVKFGFYVDANLKVYDKVTGVPL